MDLTRQMDGYCERLDPSFWAEPVNAVTNLAFMVVALVMWRRSAGVPGARWLSAVLFVIGVGSFLFHTFATVWAVIADVVPILIFTLSYIFLAARDYAGWRPVWAAGAVVAFFPYVAVLVPVLREIPFLQISAGYWPIALLIGGVGALLLRRLPAVGRGLCLGALVLALSITLRSLDMPFCDALPMGTHFWWHVLNALMLGWMIEVYRRHQRADGLASQRAAR
ncbi:ceramidase domain-containing protein [Primorskyibacter sp. S187A]|uniref:ceramidase domain-containing protein n=1 Tax=Primorskyibacter sp. S187A TaxID=3415130 RepID=UPI003C7A1CFC